MSKLSYWERRQVEDTYRYFQDAEDTADQISKVYLKASRYFSTKSDEVFERYQTKHRLSEAEARQLISTMQDKTSLDELLQKLRNGDEAKKELLAKLEAPAYQARLERMRQLQNQLDLMMRTVYQQEKDISTNFYTDLSSEAYYRQIYNTQQRAGVAFSFGHLSAEVVDRVLHSKWSGKNYSSRIWDNTQALAQNVKEELLINLVTGRTNRETAEVIANKFGQGAYNARRLVWTESSFVASEMNFKAYDACGIEMYRYLATLDLRTSAICRSLDGKVFPVKDRKIGVNCNPMHPWCRSTTISQVDDEILKKWPRSAIDPETGKEIKVPGDMTYEQWYEKYVTGNPKAQLEEKKIKNMSSDRAQHKRYREILGDNIPKSFVKFQEMKYNNAEKWNSLHIKYLDTNLKTKIRSDATNKLIEPGKQGKHIVGHNNYAKGRSYLTISLEDAQQLVNKYAGTGEIKRDRFGKWTNKEFVSADKNIGVVVDPQTGEEFVTSRFSIHYSKNGTHIVPRKGG